MKYLNPVEQKAVVQFKQTLEKELGPNLISIQLFGSKARGDFHEDSDIDLFIVVDRINKQVKEIINNASYNAILKYHVLISEIIYDKTKFLTLKKEPTSFIFNILTEGMTI